MKFSKFARMSALSVMLISAVPALGAEISIPLPGDADKSEIEVRYDCEDFDVDVSYITAGEISLATLAWPDHFIVAAQVMSADGARYAAGPYTWWVKGDEADFANVMDNDSDGLACASVN